MKVLVTGDRGYIGSILVEKLVQKGHVVVGLDSEFFSACALTTPFSDYKTINKDIRDVDISDVTGVDSIVHLAGLSNDPLGEFSPSLTQEINYSATARLAKLAKDAGVSRFVYASSQSMYGISSEDIELEEDNSSKNPLTAYAKAKWDAELHLHSLTSSDFVVTSFRPSTVFGASPRLRTDIVFNNLVACAFTTGRIEIHSDGTPWRPIVHVEDVCKAFIAGLEAPAELVAGRAFNVGVPNGNYTVREIAEAAQRAVPGSDLIFTGQHGPDSRTYRVSFNRILTELSDYFRPTWDLDSGGAELVNFFKKVGLTESDFRGRSTNRLQQLKYLVESNQVSSEFRFL